MNGRRFLVLTFGWIWALWGSVSVLGAVAMLARHGSGHVLSDPIQLMVWLTMIVYTGILPICAAILLAVRRVVGWWLMLALSVTEPMLWLRLFISDGGQGVFYLGFIILDLATVAVLLFAGRSAQAQASPVGDSGPHGP